jgi:hypothetical protein
MKRFLARRRILGAFAVLALAVAPAILLGPRPVRAFTLPPDIIFFDAVSVPVDHTAHVHIVNAIGAGPMIFRTVVRPTTPAAGSLVFSAAVTLSPGDGIDQLFPFAGFAPPPGTLRVPVTTAILVSPPGGGPLPADWSGTVVSSVEVVNDLTNVQTAILGGRHIVRGVGGVPTPCLECN